MRVDGRGGGWGMVRVDLDGIGGGGGGRRMGKWIMTGEEGGRQGDCYMGPARPVVEM